MNKGVLAFVLVGFFVLLGIFLLDYNEILGLMSMSVSIGLLIAIGIFYTDWGALYINERLNEGGEKNG